MKTIAELEAMPTRDLARVTYSELERALAPCVDEAGRIARADVEHRKTCRPCADYMNGHRFAPRCDVGERFAREWAASAGRSFRIMRRWNS